MVTEISRSMWERITKQSLRVTLRKIQTENTTKNLSTSEKK